MIVIICYVAVFAKLNQVQVLQAQAYSDRPDNFRQLQRDFNQPAATSSPLDGKTAATSEGGPRCATSGCTRRRAALRRDRLLLVHVGLRRCGAHLQRAGGRTPSLKLHRLSGFSPTPRARVTWC